MTKPYHDRAWSVVYPDVRSPVCRRKWDIECEAFARSRPTSEWTAFGRVLRFRNIRLDSQECVYSFVPTGPNLDASEQAAELLARFMVEQHGGTLEPPETTP